MAQTKYGKYIVTQLIAPHHMSAEFTAKYVQFARRILWLDDGVVEGASQLTCAWYSKPNDPSMSGSHSHDSDEVIGLFGSNPEDPHNLNGEVEFWLEDEKHILTQSCLIFIPRGMKHCPLLLKKVDRPIFHLSTLTKGNYEWKTT